MKKESDLNGAWEEPGVIGTRIEIEGNSITVLWRNAPVLVTKFKKVESEEGVELQLQKSGLRYEQSDSDYATLTKLFYHDGKLEMVEDFPITGESVSTLKRTENSRYGNYEIADDVLKELEGTWKDEDGYDELVFSKDTLKNKNQKIKIHVVKSNSSDSQSRDFRIIDQDASHYGIFDFVTLEYQDGVLIGRIMVCDAPSPKVIFKKCL